MAIVYVDKIAGSTFSSPLSLTWPLGAPVAGDTLLAWTGGGTANGAVVPPAGWTTIVGGGTYGGQTYYSNADFFYKRLTATDLATLTWDLATSGITLLVSMLRIQGCTNVVPQWVQNYALSDSATTAPLTPTAINGQVLAAFIATGNTAQTAFATPPGYSLLLYQQPTNNNQIGVFSYNTPTPDTVNAITATTSGGGGGANVTNGYLVILYSSTALSLTGGATLSISRKGSTAPIKLYSLGLSIATKSVRSLVATHNATVALSFKGQRTARRQGNVILTPVFKGVTGRLLTGGVTLNISCRGLNTKTCLGAVRLNLSTQGLQLVSSAYNTNGVVLHLTGVGSRVVVRKGSALIPATYIGSRSLAISYNKSLTLSAKSDTSINANRYFTLPISYTAKSTLVRASTFSPKLGFNESRFITRVAGNKTLSLVYSSLRNSSTTLRGNFALSISSSHILSLTRKANLILPIVYANKRSLIHTETLALATALASTRTLACVSAAILRVASVGKASVIHNYNKLLTPYISGKAQFPILKSGASLSLAGQGQSSVKRQASFFLPVLVRGTRAVRMIAMANIPIATSNNRQQMRVGSVYVPLRFAVAGARSVVARGIVAVPPYSTGTRKIYCAADISLTLGVIGRRAPTLFGRKILSVSVRSTQGYTGGMRLNTVNAGVRTVTAWNDVALTPKIAFNVPVLNAFNATIIPTLLETELVIPTKLET